MIGYEAMRSMEGLLLGSVEQKYNGMEERVLGNGHQTHGLEHGHNHNLGITGS